MRMFAYGLISIILVLYLARRGLTENQIELLTLTLVGDAIISLEITLIADRAARCITLIIIAVLMIFAGIMFAATGNFIVCKFGKRPT